MGLISKFLEAPARLVGDRLNAKAAAPRLVSQGYGRLYPRPVWPASNYQAIATNAYQRNPDGYGGVSKIARAAKQVTFTTIKGSDALLKLLESPNPAQTGSTFLEYWISFLLLSGTAYIQAVENFSGEPSQLILHRPDYMAVELAGDNFTPIGYVWRRPNLGRQVHFTLEEIIRSRLFSPLDDYYGMSPLAPAMASVDTENESAAMVKRTLQRGFVPGVIEAIAETEDQDWTDEDITALHNAIQHSKDTGEELFLQNAKWNQIGVKPVDSGFEEINLQGKRNIASVLSIGSELLGDAANKTYSNYHEARRGLYTEAVLPLIVQFRDDLNRTVGARLGSVIDIDKDSLDALSDQREVVSQRVGRLFQAGLITINEARAELGYPTIGAEGEQRYMPASMVPSDVIDETPIPEPAEPAKSGKLERVA